MILAGLITQFQMAVGVPLFLLLCLHTLYKSSVSRKWFQPLILLLITIPLATFIIFDFKYDWLQLKAFLAYSDESAQVMDLSQRLDNRFLGLIDLQIIHNPSHQLHLALFVVVFFLTLKLGWSSKHRSLCAIIVAYYLGYYLLSLKNDGVLLWHYIYPMMSFGVLLITLLYTSSKKHLLSLVVLILMFNYFQANEFKKQSSEFIGKSQFSWRFLTTVADTVADSANDEFGYFVYSPDGFGYQPKYAMFYHLNRLESTVSYFEKRPQTFVIMAPVPSDRVDLDPNWWIKSELGIGSPPVSVVSFENGYQVREYQLTDEDLESPVNPYIDLGLNFR